MPEEVDHVVPRFKGGTNTESSLVASCADCNRSKGIQDA
jgi:5-methylcytosine-specific restriction endonuclease McrA